MVEYRQLYSRALARTVPFVAVFPSPEHTTSKGYPVLLQLHGYTDDYSSWLHKSRLLEYAEDLPLIIICPDGLNSWWSNSDLMQYEDFIVNDVWHHVHTSFPVCRDSRWSIGGNSMGGYGAIRLGLKYPEKFCSIYAHSSRIPVKNDQFVQNDPRWYTLFGHKLIDDLDCYSLVHRVVHHDSISLSFDCGLEDHLLTDNRNFHGYLDQIRFPHTYTEHEGGHDWSYWDKRLKDALSQHMRVLHSYEK